MDQNGHYGIKLNLSPISHWLRSDGFCSTIVSDCLQAFAIGARYVSCSSFLSLAATYAAGQDQFSKRLGLTPAWVGWTLSDWPMLDEFRARSQIGDKCIQHKALMAHSQQVFRCKHGQTSSGSMDWSVDFGPISSCEFRFYSTWLNWLNQVAFLFASNLEQVSSQSVRSPILLLLIWMARPDGNHPSILIVDALTCIRIWAQIRFAIVIQHINVGSSIVC